MQTLISLADEFRRIAGPTMVLGDPHGEPAYLYVRSSSKLQAIEGKESLSRQLLFGHEKATEDGRFIPLDMTYWDVWRGKDADRPEFLHLLSDVKNDRRSDQIYIDQTDRLSRSTAVYYVLLHDLTRHGLTPRFESKEDDLVRHIKLAFDEIELERRSYRQVQANKARAIKGYLTVKTPSFGYDPTKDKRGYIINEEQAYWVCKIFDWYTSGRSLRWIAKTLTDQGLPTPRKQRKGWDPSTIQRMLANTVYKGTFIANRRIREYVWDAGRQKLSYDLKPEDEWIYIDVPAIVSEEQWNEVQERLTKNKKLSARNSQKNQWLLHMMVKCVCGNHYCGEYSCIRNRSVSGEIKLSEKYYYRCSGRNRTGPEVCKQKQVRQDFIEPMILKALEQMIFKVELWDEVLASKDDQRQRLTQHLMVCQKQIKEIDNQLEELLQLALEQRTDSIRKLFLEKQAELEKQRVLHEEQLKITQDRIALIEASANRREALDGILAKLQKLGGLTELPFDQQRRLVTLLIDEIILDTSEQWFEIRGELNDRFSYGEDKAVMLNPD